MDVKKNKNKKSHEIIYEKNIVVQTLNMLFISIIWLFCFSIQALSLYYCQELNINIGLKIPLLQEDLDFAYIAQIKKEYEIENLLKKYVALKQDYMFALTRAQLLTGQKSRLVIRRPDLDKQLFKEGILAIVPYLKKIETALNWYEKELLKIQDELEEYKNYSHPFIIKLRDKIDLIIISIKEKIIKKK